jgi:HNH endonuclease
MVYIAVLETAGVNPHASSSVARCTMPYKDKSIQYRYQTARLCERRLKWLAENGPCKQCGSLDRLEVDHIDPGKKSTHRIWSYSLEKRLAELSKCQVLCYSCHKKKSASECARGEDHSRAKLSAETVLRMRELHKSGAKQSELCVMFSLPKTTMSAIIRRATWRHI